MPAAMDLPNVSGASVSVVSHSDEEDASAGDVVRDADAHGGVLVKNERDVSLRDASAVVWTRRAPVRIDRVALTDTSVYVVSQDTVGEWNVHALDRRDGAVRWARHVEAMSLVLIPACSRLTWVRDSVLSEVSIDRGVELWSYAFAHEPSAARIESGDWVVSGSEIGTTRLRVDTSRREVPLRVAGHVRVRGFASNEGIDIAANGRWSAKTRADGSFDLTVPVRGTLTLWSSAPRDARAEALERAAMGPGVFAWYLSPYTSAIDADQAARDGIEIELGGGPVMTKD